ncbi:uncharacterized protein TNCV_1580021 [Trichonephila clavipes]|nr:uncharacterized protein TNCV_1580021 [Trichonephila clavipes]
MTTDVIFSVRHCSAVRCLGARGTMTTTSYHSRSAVGVRQLFFRRATTLLYVRVLMHAERWQRYPNASAAVGVRHFFVRGTTLLSGRVLGARGTMTTTSYRSRLAVGVRRLFSVNALLCGPVVSWCTRNDDNDILPQPLGGGCSSFFPSGTTLLSGRVLVHAER